MLKKVKGFENYKMNDEGDIFDNNGNKMKIFIYHKIPTIVKKKGDSSFQLKQYLIFYQTFGYSFFPKLVDLENEEWKIIEKHPNYAVSNLGRAKNLITEKELSYCDNGHGYQRIMMDAHHYYLHRVIGETFIRPLKQGEQIDHINTIKNDNRLENLRIVTAKENHDNPLTLQKFKKMKNWSDNKYHRGKFIYEKTLDDKIICAWRTITDAAKHYGVGNSAIGNCLKGLNTTSCGRKWEYVKTNED